MWRWIKRCKVLMYVDGTSVNLVLIAHYEFENVIKAVSRCCYVNGFAM